MTTLIGNKQLLVLGSITLTLEQCDFAATEDNSLGYSRAPISSSTASIDYNYYGTSIVRKGRHFPKKQFAWNLNLSNEKTHILKALYDEQRFLIEEYLCDIDAANPTLNPFYIELIDGRLADLEKDTFDRSYDTATTMGITLPSSPLAGWSYRWYRYLIQINSIEGLDRVFMPNQDLCNVQVSAQELDFAKVPSFPVTDLL